MRLTDVAKHAHTSLTAHTAPRHSYGYLTWEWFAGLRGWAHPLLFAALFRALAALRLDTPALLALAPRLLQAGFCACGDVATYVLAGRLFGSADTARLALLCHVASWFVFFAGVRTFSTSLEAPLSAVALALWPWRVHSVNNLPGSHLSASLALAAAACVVRPSAALLWAPLAAVEVLSRDRAFTRALLLRAVLVGGAALAASLALDAALYGTFTCVACRFVSFNLLSSGADAYGTQARHWYLTSGGPTALATMTPLVIIGAATAPRAAAPLACACAGFVAVLSLTRHKEFRFLLPLMPPACAFAGAALATLRGGGGRGEKPMPRWMPRGRGCFRSCVAFLVAPQALGALYLSLWHQAAPAPAMAYLASAAAAGRVGPGGILLLTPCHETPGYSHLHKPVPLAILDCSPDWRGERAGQHNERDAFFDDPEAHLRRKFDALDAGGSGGWSGSEAWAARVGAGVPPLRGLPSHVVVFDDVAPAVDALLRARGYALAARFFHAHFAVDREQRELLAYELQRTR